MSNTNNADVLNVVLEKLIETQKKIRSIDSEKKYYSTDDLKHEVSRRSQPLDQAILFLREVTGNIGIEPIPYQVNQAVSYSKRGEEHYETHESYGVIEVTKPSGRVQLVGSMVDSLPNCISIRVKRAERHIDSGLHTEHYFGRGQLMEVDLSVYQWAELISSMNGVSVPCTIRNVLGVQMEGVPEEAKTPLEQIAHDAKKESRKNINEGEQAFKDDIKALCDHVDTLKLSGTKAASLKKMIQNLHEKHVSAPVCAAAWASQRIAEDTEKAVSQSKVEIAAAFTGIIQKHGLQALQEKLGIEAANVVPQLTTKDT